MSAETIDKRRAEQERQLWAPFVDLRDGAVSTLETTAEKINGRQKPELWKYGLLAAKVGFVAIYGWPVAVAMTATLGAQAFLHNRGEVPRVKHHLEDTTRKLGTAFDTGTKQEYADALRLLSNNDVAPDKARGLLDAYNAQTQQAGMGGADAPRLVIVSPEKDPQTYKQYKQMMGAQGVMAMTMHDTGEQVLVASVNHIRSTPADQLHREVAQGLAAHKVGPADTRPTLADALNKTANKFMVAGAVWHYGLNVAFDWARPIFPGSSAWGATALIAQPMAAINAGIMYGAMKLANNTQKKLNDGKISHHNKILNRAALIIKNSAEIAAKHLPKPNGPAGQDHGHRAGLKAAAPQPQGQSLSQNQNPDKSFSVKNLASNFFNTATGTSGPETSAPAAQQTPAAPVPAQNTVRGLRGGAWRKGM